MKAQIYRLKINYDGYEKILNRTVDVSSNFTMAKLGYLVLAAFDTLAYHLFYLRFNGRRYELETDDNFRSIGMEEMTDPRTVKLNQLGMNIGDEISMCYDYGCDQMFTIKLESLADMEKGTASEYPKVIDGAGKGILDDIFPGEFGKIVSKIKKNGKSDHEYLSPYGDTRLWDYRDFDLELMNKQLKNDILHIARGYEAE